jgi:hypothetical protein
MTQTMPVTPTVTLEKIDWDKGYNGFASIMMQHGFSQDESFITAIAFTRLCYGYARKFSQDYQGDFWCWYIQSDEGFFICPQTEKAYRIEVHSNYYRGEMSTQALGITVSLYALCIMAESGHEFFIQNYHRLRDFAVRHPEWAAIVGAID